MHHRSHYRRGKEALWKGSTKSAGRCWGKGLFSLLSSPALSPASHWVHLLTQRKWLRAVANSCFPALVPAFNLVSQIPTARRGHHYIPKPIHAAGWEPPSPRDVPCRDALVGTWGLWLKGAAPSGSALSVPTTLRVDVTHVQAGAGPACGCGAAAGPGAAVYPHITVSCGMVRGAQP